MSALYREYASLPSDHGLESSILLAELLKLSELAHIEARILVPPTVKGRRRDARLPADIDDGGATFGLPQRLQNLLRRELALSHLWPPLSRECGLDLQSCQNGGPAGLRFGDRGLMKFQRGFEA
jgi:hypothetical protein